MLIEFFLENLLFFWSKVEKNLRLIWSKDKTSLVRFSQEVRRESEMAREREFLKTERDVLRKKTLQREIQDGRERGEKRGEERETGRGRERK